jgi:hypothetical protein
MDDWPKAYAAYLQSGNPYTGQGFFANPWNPMRFNLGSAIGASYANAARNAAGIQAAMNPVLQQRIAARESQGVAELQRQADFERSRQLTEQARLQANSLMEQARNQSLYGGLGLTTQANTELAKAKLEADALLEAQRLKSATLAQVLGGLGGLFGGAKGPGISTDYGAGTTLGRTQPATVAQYAPTRRPPAPPRRS